jgi:hypothetical protein
MFKKDMISFYNRPEDLFKDPDYPESSTKKRKKEKIQTQ